MGYGMKYTKGGFPFKTDLTKKPNPTTKAVPVDHSKTLSTHLDNRGPIKGDYQMENKGDFNISNLHKDTKMSLKDKNYKKFSDLEKHDDDRPVNPEPSFPATPKGSKQRSKAENKLEKTEDEKGL